MFRKLKNEWWTYLYWHFKCFICLSELSLIQIRKVCFKAPKCCLGISAHGSRCHWENFKEDIRMSESLAKIVYRKLKHLHQVQWDTYSTYSKAPGSDTGVWRTVVLCLVLMWCLYGIQKLINYKPFLSKKKIMWQLIRTMTLSCLSRWWRKY